MSEELAKYETEQRDVNLVTIDDVKKLWCPTATEKEMLIFIGVAKSFNLNPFKREIHLIKYKDSPAQIVVGYEAFLKRAERTGKLDGWKVEIIPNKDKKELDIARVTIHKKGWKEPFVWEIVRREADKKQATWLTMGDFMFKKVCIGQGFRMAFPDDLGGMPYLEEERDYEEVKTDFVPHKTTDEVKPEEKVIEAEVQQPPSEEKPKGKLATQEQVLEINSLVQKTSEPAKWSDYIVNAYKVNVYTELLAEEAVKIIAMLKEGISAKGKKNTVKDVFTEAQEDYQKAVREPKEEKKEEEKTGKPISQKQIDFIKKMMKHYREEEARKLAMLLLAEGAGSIELLTSRGASNIIAKVQADIDRDHAAAKAKKAEEAAKETK